ncbi:Serine/threonine kinase [Clydaea vesicula]|uniref:protein kinase C n=1 Tax=Clydaea vesicula TaxID=447962 RepID=A0AAD5Y2G5_9FUNG|nr:Serine/threonine kinase [Clydaea vesicula]
MSSKDESKLQELIQKIQIEKKLGEGAQQMLKKLTDPDAKQLCQLNLLQSQQKIEFLETELKKLSLKINKSNPDTTSTLNLSSGNLNPNPYARRESSLIDDEYSDSHIQPSPSDKKNSNSSIFSSLLSSFGKKDKSNKINNVASSTSSINSSSGRSSVNVSHNVHEQNLTPTNEPKIECVTNLDYLKVNTTLTTEKVNFRLNHIKGKLDLEQKVKAGTGNLLEAMKKNPNSDQKLANELKSGLEQKILEANAKIGFLNKSAQQYSGLVVTSDEEEEDVVSFRSARRTGRLRIKLLGAIGYGKRSSKDDLFCVIKVDSVVKATTKPSSKQKFDENFDIQVSKAQEVEIALYEKVSGGGHHGSTLLSIVWFSLLDLEDDLSQKYGQHYSEKKIEELNEMWLDMEPGGQILSTVSRAATHSDQVFRRQAVQKLYPRNGHKFSATQIYGVSQCAVCNEFMTSQSYSCQNCQYACHPNCYQKASTKCITELEYSILKAEGGDTNTGQLLKYNIPHKFQQTTNLSPNWCGHCGYILPIGKKVARCHECHKNSHKNCSVLIPNFCGLNPVMANALIAAWDEADKKQAQKELEEAELEASKIREAVQKENELMIQALPEKKELFMSPFQSEQELNSKNVSEKPLPVVPPTRIDSNGYEAAEAQLPHQFSSIPHIPHSHSTSSSITYNDSNSLTQQRYSTQDPRFSQAQQSPHIQNAHLYQQKGDPHQNYSPSQGYPSQSYQQGYEQNHLQQVNQNNAYQQGYPSHAYQHESEKYIHSPSENFSQQQWSSQQRPVESQVDHEQLNLQYQQQLLEQQRLAQQQEEYNRIEHQRKIEQQKILEQKQMHALEQKRKQSAAAEMVTLNDFHFVSVLGRGAFGKVMLATEKQTKKLYAIKALKKEFIIQSDDVKSTKLEKRIFQAASAAHHPFLVNLHSSFQTDSRIYFVMEYVSGGDLMCHIQDKKRFPSARTKFYACEVLLALEYFHKNNIIYRDLKLDNILMTPEGHIKVADYGICKDNIGYGVTTRTFCGTPDYMAPEILLSNRYGRAVDWWSFGVLIYVMLVGRYPFHGDDELQILDAILDDSIEYPPNLPRETFAILNQLLNRNPARRLGGGKMDAEEVKKHPYFNGVDWNAILSKQIPPPWKPTIKSPTDVSNFDSEFTKEKPVLTPINSVLSQVNQDEFKDFEYISDWAKYERMNAA